MADWFQKTVQNIGPIARYNEKEEQRRIEENKSTLDKVLDTAGNIAGGISNNYNWVKNTLSEYVPEDIQKTIAPFGDISPIGLLFSGLTGANEVEHAMQQTYAPTAAEYNYNAGKGAISGAGGVVGGIADIFGAEGTGNELNAITNLNQRDKEYSGANNILSLDYLTDPSGFTYDLSNMGGSMAALYPSSLLAAPAKVTSAAQTIGRLPFLRGLSQGARETMLRGSLTSIPEGLSEGGNVVRQSKEEGLDNPFLRGWTTAALNVPTLAVSNALEYGLLGGKLFRPGAGVNEGIPERMARGLYRSVPATAATSFQQGAEEYVQTGISNAQTDKDWGLLPWNASQDQIDALLVGAMTGAPISGATSYGRSLTTREEERGVPKGVENPQAWKAAEIAANDVGRPDLAKIIYSQWALESGRFKETSGENNYGGLKDTDGNYRDYGSIEEFAHSYANDFLRHYDLSGVETPRDFVHVLKQNGYMEADENQYADNVESIASEIQGNGTASLHTYNLAVQPGIENQLDGLTPSFRNALPYIGGILDEMGMADGSAISSAYRTPEHNREVGGVEGSYHTKGDAVDIVLPDGITDEQAQAVKKRFEDTGAFEDVLFHDAGSGYHLHLEGYKGGLGRAGKTDTATSNVNYDNALMDFADDMINNSDGETSNFFDDKTMTDANGNKTFRATPNNIRALEQRYPEAVRKIRDYVQNGTNNQTALINNNTTRTGASGSTDNTNTINIETPSLDRLREFARRKVKTSRNPEEINNLQALFKTRNEDSGEFSDNQRAQDYLMKNYANELQRNGTTAQGGTAQQNIPKPTNNTVNPQNNNNQSQQTSPIAQIAEQARQQERQSNELLTRINNNVNQPAYGVINGQQPSQDNFAQDIFANLIRQQQQADEQARRQAEIERQYNQINSGLTTTEIPATSGTQYEQDNLAQDIFTNTVRQQQQADEQTRRQAEVEKQYNQIKGGLNATENPATTGTQATAPINQQRLQEVSNDVKRYAKARDEFSRQENINKLARNINSLFNGDYTMPNDGADESRYSLRKLSEAIDKEKRRNEIYDSLTPEEQEFMNWLDVVYDNTGKLFKDIYKNVLDERTQKINDYKEILRSQMKQGVTPRSVAYNRDTGEYTNLPGFSNNYQWYRDMTANGTRRISKKELEENLEYIAIDHLSNGYVDPQYGVQVPPEAVEDFKQTEDAINGLQEIAGKAQRYEEGRSLSRVSETGRTESQRNIQQTQTETTAAIRRDAIHYGKKLHDRLRQTKERGEIQNPTSVNLERLEKDINSDSPVKQKKAIEFMENKLDKELPTKEKIAFREEVINELAPKREKGTTPNTEALQDETSTEKEMTEQKPKTKYKLAEGYKTENGNSLAEADENEYVIKPDGSMDFGKITEEISQGTNGELQPGKIRLRVGNEKQGLIHAKKHEKQAQHIGYKSVEDMISDVAQNFDAIYKKDNGKGKRATYSLVKLNNNNTKAKQNVVPTYFELQNDGSNYYIVITAIPKNVGSFRNQIKKETLIYSKQGQDIAAISSDSAVRLSQSNNNAGVTEERLPVSVKSNVSSTNSISENKTANNENPIKEVNEKQRSFVDVRTAEENLLNAFGLKRANATEEKPKPTKKRIKIVDDSDEALEAEWNKLNKALDNMSSMPFFNPDTVVPLFKIGMIYAQRGINNFANFSERMIAKGGDRIKPWVKPAWNMTASYEGNDLDEKKLAAAFQYVGSKWENGETALGKIKHDFQQLVGKEAAEPYMQYIDTAYKGAQAYFNPDTPVIQLKENTSNEVNENVNGTASSNTQRNSERNNQNAVGNTDEGEVAAGRSGNEDNGQTSQNTARRSSVRVQSSSSDTGGKAGNSAVRNDKSANTNGSTRDTDLPRSIRDSYEGSTVSDEGRTETVDRVVEERPVNEINSLKQDKAIPKERRKIIEAYANNPGIAVFEDADVGGYGVLATRKTYHSFFMGDHLTENEYALYKAVKDGLVDESTLLENKDSDKFIKIADSRDNAQYSLEDDMRKKLKNYTDLRETAVMLEDNELTDREKEISEIGKRLGTPVMWFKAAPGFRGWHSDGITYLNKNANWSHPKVFWHEVFHWIRNNNPKLFADMVNYIQTRAPFTGKQLDDYAATIHNGQNMTDAELVEEMMADNMVYVTRRVKFLRDLGKINHSLVKRFVYAIHDLMNRFIDFLNNPRAGLTNKQKKLMVTAFTNTAMSIKDQKGNNIFKKGSDGEIVIDDNRDLYSMSKEEEDMLKEIYGEDLSDLFNDDDDYSARFSADNDKSIDSGTGTFKGAFRNIKQKFTRRKNDKRIKVYNKSARDTKIDKLGNIGGFEAILASPSRLAEKYPAFKPVLTYAENAMRRLLKNRNYYNKKLNEAYDYLEDKEKDLQELNDLMFKGDAVSTEYGKGIEDFEERAKAIVEETGVKEGTAKAYIAIRKLLDECYNIVNRARTQVQIKSETISKSQLEGLKQNKFVTILNEVQSETKEDDVLVTYEIRPSRIKKDIVTKQQLEELRKNEAIQIMEEREGVREKDGSEYVYGNDYSTPKGEKINLENNKLYTVKYREAIPKVNKLEGYIPHFFHDFFVVVQNEDGTTTTVDSGHNVKEAYQKAEQYLKDNKDAKLIIRPKRFDFQEVGIDEEYYAEMVGDGAYQKINERIADEFDMTIDEAKKLLDNKNKKMPKPKRSSRHRFWGNIQHRTGAKGYESQDLDWVLRHYFNSACRYEALETEFKPKAIGYFERIYGRFDTDNKKLSGTARYIKDYINDVNGNPSAMEVAISTWLNNRRLFRYMFTSRYGERAALSVAAGITNKMSIAKLGVWNVSSALLNLTQLLNTTALLTRKNPVKAAWEIARACKDIAALTEKQSVKRVENLKPDERKALEDSGVFDELGLDSGAGYSKISFGKWANRSMVLFKAAERLARYATVLAAYRMGRNELNKNHDEAVEYAREINRKANFDYGVNDAPNLFRRGSILSQILFQFYKYPIKQFELMREFMPFNGKKDTTWQQKATFWGGWIFFAGAFGLPAEDLLWATIDLISENVFGIKSKQAVRQFLLEASKDASLPERVAIRTLMYGGLSNFGIDISTRVGMADVIPGLGEDYNKDANPLIKAAEQFGGVTGGTIAQFYNSATKGDNMGMLRAISPGAYNIYTAAIGESTDGRGRITTKYDDALSRIIRGMGFKSTTEAVESEALSLKYYNMDKTAKEKQSAVDDYLDAEEEGKPLAPYARRLKELGVKKSTVKKARENRKKDRMQRGFEKDVPDYAKGAMNL